MPRVFIYLLPVALDTVLSSMFFLVTVHAAASGFTAMQVGGLLSIWSVFYMLTSVAMAFLANRRSAAWYMMLSCAGIIGLSIAYLGSPGMRTLYVLMAICGCVAASFFAPFQVFMKYVDAGGGRSVSKSSGLYVCSWSSGFALGPFVAGALWQHFGWNVCHLLNAGACALIGVSVFGLRHYAHEVDDHVLAGNGSAGSDEAAYARYPDLAWMAWVFGGVGCMIVSLIRGAFPVSGEAFAISKASQGNVFAILSGVQALVGLFLGRFRFWAYRPLPLVLFGLIGVLGLVLFGEAKTTLGFSLAAGCLGIYTGSFVFYFVFHSLVHPHRGARYVAINEAVVGLMSMIGPLMCGWIVPRAGLRGAYLASAGIILGITLIQAVIHTVKLPSRTQPTDLPVLEVAGPVT